MHDRSPPLRAGDDAELKLGNCRLVPRELLVVDADHRLSLEPRVMNVLMALAKRDGATVTREELLEEAWQARIVTDDAVHRAVSKLRAALASAPGLGLSVETVPRMGYRLRIETPAAALGTGVAGAAATESASSSAAVLPAEFMHETASAGTSRQLRRWYLPALLLAAGLAALWWSAPWREGSRGRAGVGASQLPDPHWTTLNIAPGLGHMPSFSADGEHLVYSLGSDEGEQLWRYSLLQREAHALTSTTGMDYAATQSLQGGRIAFLRQLGRDCAVMLLRPESPTPGRIGDCTALNGRIAISPDGRSLVLSDRPDSARHANRLYLIDTETGERRPLLVPPGHEGDYRPRWSSDGQWIAFTRVYARLHTRIMRVRADGSDAEVLLQPPQYVHQVAWRGPDQLIYTQAGSDVNSLWSLNIGSAPELLTSVGAGKPSIDISADGRRLALSLTRQVRVNQRLRFHVSDPAESLELLQGPLALARDLAVSPDGERIAIEHESLGEAGIWVMNAGSALPRKLWGATRSRITDLSWDAQGQRLAFELASDGDQDICHIGSEPEPICLRDPSRRAMAPAWSLDGQWLYFAASDGGAWYVYRSRPDGSQMQRASEKQAVYARESADGRFLLLRRRGEDGIWQIALDGSAESLLIDDAAFEQPRAFVPVAEGVYYVSRDNALRFYEYASKARRTLHRFQGYPPRSLNVTADQWEALFSQMVNEQADLSVLNNLDALLPARR